MSKVRTLEMNPTRGRSLRPFPRGTAGYVSGSSRREFILAPCITRSAHTPCTGSTRSRWTSWRTGTASESWGEGSDGRWPGGKGRQAQFSFPRLTAERFPAARTLRANLAQPHRAAGPSLPGSAGVRPREAPGLIIPARARSCRLASPGHCRRVDQCHAGFFCTCSLYSLSRVDAGQESTQGRRRQTQTRDAAVNRSTISGLIDQAVAQYAREIGVQDAPPGRTA